MTLAELGDVPARSSAAPLSALHVVSAPTPLARALAAELEAAGVAVSLAPAAPDSATAVLFLAGLADDVADPDACVREVFGQLRAFGQRHREEPARVYVAFDTGGDLGLRTDPGSRATLGALAGLAKTAAREWPSARVQVLDVAAAGRTPEAVARALAAELRCASDEIEIGLAGDGRRVAPRLSPVIASRAPRTLTAQGVWVVSGGARGVTAPCLLALARRIPLRFVLLGRTPIDLPEPPEVGGATTDAEIKQALLHASRQRGAALSPRQLQQEASGLLARREARASCDALRAAGAEVRYEAVDVAEAPALARLLATVRAEWGPVRGVVHAAGVLADKALHEKTDEQFARVYGTKVAGFRALHAATRDDPLEVLCCFSSVAARMGNAGQADYAAANEALNKLCQAEQHRRGERCLVRAINWGPWEGGMVSPALRAHFAAQGVPLIPLDAGAEAFADIVTGVAPVGVESVVGGVLPAAGPVRQPSAVLAAS